MGDNSKNLEPVYGVVLEHTGGIFVLDAQQEFMKVRFSNGSIEDVAISIDDRRPPIGSAFEATLGDNSFIRFNKDHNLIPGGIDDETPVPFLYNLKQIPLSALPQAEPAPNRNLADRFAARFAELRVEQGAKEGAKTLSDFGSYRRVLARRVTELSSAVSNRDAAVARISDGSGTVADRFTARQAEIIIERTGTAGISAASTLAAYDTASKVNPDSGAAILSAAYQEEATSPATAGTAARERAMTGFGRNRTFSRDI